MDTQSRCTGLCQRAEEGVFIGWAINVLESQKPTTIFAYIDDKKIAEIECNESNEKVQKKLNFFRSNIGFKFVVPEQFKDGQNHKLSFRYIDDSVMFILDNKQNNQQVTYIHFNLLKKNTTIKYNSNVDGWQNGCIFGWVLKQDLITGKQTGNCTVLVTMNGVELKKVQANRYRGDVASVYSGDARCGFSVFIPFILRKAVKAEFRIYVLPDHIELRNSPYTATLVNDLLEQKLLNVDRKIDSLYKEILSLRSEIKSFVSYPEYTLDEYEIWAQKYYASLSKKLLNLREYFNEIYGKNKSPLISIICPVYKPELSFFIEAVESVLQQTYVNWELLLVDDGGGEPSIQKEMKAFAKADKRIKITILKKNQGISVATNTALKKAKGEWIAFLDHDDALLPESLEIMLLEAQLNDSDLIYSDEDKIDINGTYMGPHLKPDFNYRYLLGCNYICHFVMVKHEMADKVGQFNSKYDGAQDHDFLLRLTEIIEPSKIYHVREVLYHWRMTKNSTAEKITNKEYAIGAGIACVNDHLKRTDRSATVSSIEKMPLYRVMWNNKPQSTVTIFIPFKDQVKITKKCVDCILHKTQYKNYTIMLIDNGSQELETLKFIQEYSRKKKVKILSINDVFNFSRLNNLAVKKVKSDFYLFLNNDVFIEDSMWLDTMLNEALLFEDVAVVGAKLLYPNKKVQHAGVIVGPDVVAYHMSCDLSEEEGGYAARFLLSQELTAVTAAMMLVRASVFHEMGGFDEKNLKVAYNDVDFCLRVREAGYRIVMCMDVVATHYESFSRGSDDQPQHQERFAYEREFINNKWKEKSIYQNDPAYSPHFKVKPQLFYELTDPEQS